MQSKEVRQMADDRISSDLIRGHIDTMLLRVLAERDSYGYEIVKTISQKSGGAYELKEPSLYTSLKRLEKESLIESYWGEESQGGRRKYYHLTPKGGTQLAAAIQQWQAAQQVINAILS
jgi:DNA-binding PadR family transcriptional regulator